MTNPTEAGCLESELLATLLLIIGQDGKLQSLGALHDASSVEVKI
jgi:hypothetical protein